MEKFLNLKSCFLFFSLFFSFSFVFADNLILTQYPESPKEGEQVTLTLDSDKYNLNIAKITWTVDGSQADSGIGRKTYSIKTSQNGFGQVVAVHVEQDGYDSSDAQKVVEANTNFILYEGANSYVPNFYKGRRLPGKEGTVRAAFFSFKNGNIDGMTQDGVSNYSWKINGLDKAEYSGQNKIINNILTKVTDSSVAIKVIKEDEKGGQKTSETNIPLQNTEAIIYKTTQDKLIKQVLGDSEAGKQIYLLVEPFFFSASNKSDSNLVYTWKINNLETKTSTPWSVVFTGKQKGAIKINLDIINNTKITQDASRGFTFQAQ